MSKTLAKPFAGEKPDITAAQIGSGGAVAAAGLAAYGLGMKGVDLYVFLGCVTFFASVVVLADSRIRGARNAASAPLFGAEWEVDSGDAEDDE